MKQISDPTPAVPTDFIFPDYKETDEQLEQKSQADALLRQGNRDLSKEIYDFLLVELPTSEFKSKIAHNASEAVIDLEAKEKYLRQCLESDPKHRKARVKLANIFEKKDDWIGCQVEWTRIEEISELTEAEKAKKEVADKKAMGATIDVLKGWGDKILGKFGMSINDFQTQKNPDGTMSIQMNKK